MKIKPRTIKHEKFKEMVKEWLDTHREEYCAFAEEVSRRDRSGFIGSSRNSGAFVKIRELKC